MSVTRTIKRGEWLITLEDDRFEVDRSEHSIPFEFTRDQLPQLISDLQELDKAASPRAALRDALAKMSQS